MTRTGRSGNGASLDDRQRVPLRFYGGQGHEASARSKWLIKRTEISQHSERGKNPASDMIRDWGGDMSVMKWPVTVSLPVSRIPRLGRRRNGRFSGDPYSLRD